MNSARAPQFTISREFDAPLALVWRAWTQRDEFAAWMAPFGVDPASVELDVRVGARYRYTMTNTETGDQFPTGGEYLQIDPMTKLAFTWGAPDAPLKGTPVITLTFSATAERTTLDFRLVGFDGKPGDGFVYDGWDEALDNLSHHLNHGQGR